jgi:opacity protein-like surface antigen
MLKKITTAVVLVTTCGLTTGVAMAQSDGIKSDGFYLEANLGWGKSNFPSSSSHMDKSGFVWAGDIGYKFMPNFAAEVGFYGYPKSDSATNAKPYLGVLALKGIMPLEDGFSLYAKTGPAWAHLSVDNANAKKNLFTWYFGLGANYSITENFYLGVGANYSLKRDNSPKEFPTLWSVTGNIGYIF